MATSLEFYRESPTRCPFGFDPRAAMKRRGLKVRTAICQKRGLVFQVWGWCWGGSMATWSISFDFTGKAPSLAEANAHTTEPLSIDTCVRE